jgi:methyl-accepting chemotaxis protein
MRNYVKSPQRRVSLTVRFSFILILAVVIPLLITVLASEFLLSPTLIDQATTEMQADATKHAKEIDAFITARLQEISYIDQLKAIQGYLSGDATFDKQATLELKSGLNLDPGYNNWSLYDTNGNFRLGYPGRPDQRGKYSGMVPSVLDQLRHGTSKTAMSGVYYNLATRQAAIDIYTVINDDTGKLIGYGSATVNLNNIWVTVNNELDAGTNNFAIVLDNRGVRIAYTNPDITQTTYPAALFKSVTPIDPTYQKLISDEDLYGNSSNSVESIADPGLQKLWQESSPTGAATFQPALENESYRVVKATGHIAPYTYFVLRPISVITKASSQQILYLFLIAIVVTIIAAIVGLLVGRSITRPIQSSVQVLRNNSESLKNLAQAEESTAMEQKWIIDSSQTGLQSVQYYANAADSAAQELHKIGANLLLNWGHLDGSLTKQGLDDIIAAAHYIEKAAELQKKSCNDLSDAIQVTVQVTDQLVSGATSASSAASTLDTVVDQLREVVGK